jgi:hypothetical protein
MQQLTLAIRTDFSRYTKKARCERWAIRITRRASRAANMYYQSALARFEKESRVAMRSLCAGQRPQEPQAAGQNRPKDGLLWSAVCPSEAMGGLRQVIQTTQHTKMQRLQAPAHKYRPRTLAT